MNVAMIYYINDVLQINYQMLAKSVINLRVYKRGV